MKLKDYLKRATDPDIKAAREAWWSELSKVGDPARRPFLVDEAFEAGWCAARGEPWTEITPAARSAS